MPYYKINNYDILPLIAENGLKITRKNVQSSVGTVTTLDGVDHIGRIRRKREVEATFLPLSTYYTNQLFSAIEPEYVTISTDIDPYSGATTYRAYIDSNSAECAKVYNADLSKWEGIAFTITEQ